MALAIIVDARKSVWANQLKQYLGISSYRTIWYMAHRIRKAMEAKSFERMDGIVGVDETYVDGKQRRAGSKSGGRTTT